MLNMSRFLPGLLWVACATVGLLWSLSAGAQFDYTTNNGGITITRYTGQGGAVTVPDTINGLPVIRIGNAAFYLSPSPSLVELGTNVTSIGSSAFFGCHSLTNLTIPGGVTNIDGAAFAYCTSLRSIAIPDSVVSLSEGIFYGCNNLTNAVLGSSIHNVNDWAFYGCSKLAQMEILTVR
jgi:hypothetical protein